VRKTPHPVRNLLEVQQNGLTKKDTVQIADALEKLVRVLGATGLDVDSPYSDLSDDTDRE
jgi:hypothetical protein